MNDDSDYVFVVTYLLSIFMLGFLVGADYTINMIRGIV